MAKPVTTRGNALYIKVETAPASGVFAHPCLINAGRGVKFTTQTNKILVPDCNNPDDVIWTDCIKFGASCAVNGAGKNDNSSVAAYFAWLASKDPKNVQVWLGTFGYWAGLFHLTSYDVTGEDINDYVQNTIALESHGVIAFTAA